MIDYSTLYYKITGNVPDYISTGINEVAHK